MMETPTLELLSQRLDRLERENRLWKFATGGMMVVMAAAVVLGTNLVRPARVVTAEKFVLQDPHGTTRAALEMTPDGTTGLNILDEDGTRQVTLQSSLSGTSSLCFLDNSDLTMEMTSRRGQGASLNLQDRMRRGSSNLYILPDGTAGLNLTRDRRGVIAQLQPEGASRLGFFDRKGIEQNGIGINADGSPTPTGSPATSISEQLSRLPSFLPRIRQPRERLNRVVAVDAS